MFLNYYSCLSTVFTFSVLQSSHTLSVFKQPEHKLETEIKLILDRHNQYRTCHHAPPLVIDRQLTKEAQNLANALASEQINLDEARRWRHGNLFITQWNLKLDDLFALNGNSKFSFNPVDKWYNEVKFYFDDRSRTDHFTRIVWKDTKKLGVGIAQNDKSFVYIVCKYDPEGNIAGLYDKNVVIPDEKMIHATDICIIPPPTSPSKKKGTTATGLKTSTATVGTGSRSEQASAASAGDYRVTSTYGLSSSTVTYDRPVSTGPSTVPTSNTSEVDMWGALAEDIKTSTPFPDSSQTWLSTPFYSSSIGPAQASTTESGRSSTVSEKYTHLGSIVWNRPSSTTIGSLPTIGVSSFPPPTLSTSSPPVSVQDFSMPTTASSAFPSEPADRTPSPFGTYESTPCESIDDFPTLSGLPEPKWEQMTSSTIAPHISTVSASETSSGSVMSVPPEFRDRLCNSSDPSGNLSCIVPPEDRPHSADTAATPSMNRTTDWLDFPDHEYGNQTGDAFSPFGKGANKAEYLKFTLLFMGLLVASMSAAVSLLAVFAIFKLFVCCRRARYANSHDAPSSPAAQTPSNLVSIIPTTNPRPISPTLSRPGSPVFQRTLVSAKLY